MLSRPACRFTLAFFASTEGDALSVRLLFAIGHLLRLPPREDAGYWLRWLFCLSRGRERHGRVGEARTRDGLREPEELRGFDSVGQDHPEAGTAQAFGIAIRCLAPVSLGDGINHG